jgi:tetratricopeptide (TPR) repeat protein
MKEVIGLSPEQPDLKFEMFRNLEHAGYMEEAIGLCRETTLPAEVVRFYNNKGVILSKTGENKEALKEYTSALRFYPDFKENYRILFNVAIAEANQKSVENLQKAEVALLRCLELCPEFEKTSQLLAQVQRALLAMNAKAG